jgi:hypothetical protein
MLTNFTIIIIYYKNSVTATFLQNVLPSIVLNLCHHAAHIFFMFDLCSLNNKLACMSHVVCICSIKIASKPCRVLLENVILNIINFFKYLFK